MSLTPQVLRPESSERLYVLAQKGEQVEIRNDSKFKSKE